MEELIKELFQMLPEGTFTDEDELQDYIDDDGVDDLFQMIPEGVFESEEQFMDYVGPLKKKDSFSDGPTQVMGSDTGQEQQISQSTAGSSVSPQRTVNRTPDRIEEALTFNERYQEDINFKPKNPVGTRYGASTETGEKNTWLEELVGKNEVTDFFGDIYRAGAQGAAQGGTIDDARRLFTSGASASQEDIAKYIEAVKTMDNYGMSDEMKSFNRIYEENGGGVLGFVKGVAVNPTVIGQLFLSSVVSMANPDVAAAAGAGAAVGAGTGAAIGAAAGSIGTPIGSAIAGTIGAGSGAITGSLMAASGTLETGLAFTEFLKEAVEEKGLKFDNKSIAQVLNDPEALQNIRNKSIARGLVIGTVDAFTRGVAGKLGGSTIKAAKAAKKTVTGSMKARAALKAAGIEAVGGSTGEAAARAVTGQEQDTAEILFEGVTGQASSVLSIPQAITGNSLTDMGRNLVGKGTDIFKPPSYGYLTKKGTKMLMSKVDIEKSIDTMTDQEIIDSNFVIENDTDLQNKYRNRQQDAKNNKEAPANIVGSQRETYLSLLKERDNMENPDTPENKKRLSDINEQLNELINEADSNLIEEVEITQEDGTVVKEKIGVTQKQAIDALKEEGVEKPTDDQVKNKQKELLKFAVEAAKVTGKNLVDSRNVKNLSEEEANDLATDQLISEGIVEPTEQQINERANAIQESSAAQVDVQESTEGRPTVGDGNTTGVVAEQGETQNQSVDKPVETQTQEEINVNIAPFYETSVESTTEAGGLRKSPQYQEYKSGLQDAANELGLEIEIEEGVGGYVNEAGTKIREISNVVKLKNASLQQAAEYAALLAALSPEIQESSIAAEYVTDDTPGITGQEYILEVSDSEGTFQALKEVGIDEYTLNESNNLLTLFKFNDSTEVDVLNKLKSLKENLDGRNIQYTAKERASIRSEYITAKERKSFLTALRRSLIEQGREGTNLYQKVLSAINRDAKSQGITSNEYVGNNPNQITDADGRIVDPFLEEAKVGQKSRVQKIIDGIIKKTKARKVGKNTNPKLLLKNALDYLKTSKLYQQLDDVSRNDLVRKLNEQLGIKIKKAPSVKKILGKPKDKKVVVNERTALKDQIRRQAKAARESAGAYKKALKGIAAELKSFGKRLGKISQTKVNAITTRFASVNLNNQKSVDSFLKFVDNVFTKADYVQRLNSAKKFAKNAKTQISGAKTGVLPVDLKAALNTLFSINVNLVPENKLNTYLELAQEYGSTKPILDLKTAEETLPKVLDVLNSVIEDVDADIDGIKAEPVSKEFDVDAEVESIVTQQKDITKADLENIPNDRARDDARRLAGLSKTDILKLEESDIKVLNQVLNNIKNGFAGKAVTDLVTKLNAMESEASLNPIVGKFSRNKYIDGITNLYSNLKSLKTGKSFLQERIRNLSTFFIDDVFGNFNSKTVYNNTFGKLARALESFKSKMAKVQAKIDAAGKILEFDGSRLGISRNNLVKKKYKLRMLQLQREHESNIVDGKPNAKAPSAIDFAKKTIEAINDGDVLIERDGIILQELITEFETDGQISLEKLEKSLTAKEKKALALYDEVNSSLAGEAEFISANLHGNKINLLNNYSHHSVLQSKDKQAPNQLEKLLNRFNQVVKTKSNTIVERTNGAKPISFDPGYSALRGAQETYMDYEMTQSLREVDMTIQMLKKKFKKEGSKDTKSAINALEKVKNEMNDIILRGTFVDTGTTNLSIQRLGYQAALASVYRMGAEIIGNLGLILKNPAVATRAFTQFGGFVINPKNTTQMFDALTRLKSSQTSKLTDSDALASKHTQMSDYGGVDSSAGTATSRMSNVIGQILRYTGAKMTARITDKLASKIITFPDQMMSGPLWFGRWATTFESQVKALTGKDIKITSEDFKKIADGTSEYLTPEFAKAIEASTAAADADVVTMATSNNAYDGIVKNMRRTNDGTLMGLYRMANSYMARFSLYEYGSARNAIYALYNNGDLSKGEAVGLLAGITFRMSAYMVTYTTLTSLLDDELFDAKDDRQEEELEDIMARQIIGAMVSLISRQSLGNIPSILTNYMIEEGINRPYLGELRGGDEYDKYQHSLVFSLIGQEDIKNKPLEELMVDTLAGPYGPVINTLSRILKLTASSQTSKKPETRAAAEEELLERMTIEALGNLGLIPFYKDIRRVIVKKRFYKDPKKLTPAQLRLLKEQNIDPRRPQRDGEQRGSNTDRRSNTRRGGDRRSNSRRQ